MLLFIDVDGVLLGKNDPSRPDLALAGGCEDFLDYVLGHFDCYWLTSHCRGNAVAVIEYLRPYATTAVLDRLKEIQPSNYRTFKTEALHGDYVWIDDAPTMYEVDYLDMLGQLHRWLQVDTRKDYWALCGLLPHLETIVKHGFGRG